jgi:hypothetical protein
VTNVPTERCGKTDRNDWDTACRNFKTSISSLYHNKNGAFYFSLQKYFSTEFLLFALLLFGGDIYRQQVASFSRLVGGGIENGWSWCAPFTYFLADFNCLTTHF